MRIDCPLCAGFNPRLPLSPLSEIQVPDGIQSNEAKVLAVSQCHRSGDSSHQFVVDLWDELQMKDRGIAQLEWEKKQAVFRADHAEGRAARAEKLLKGADND